MTIILRIAALLIFFSQSGLSLAKVICWDYTDPRLGQSISPGINGMPSVPTVVKSFSLPLIDANTVKNTATLGTLASQEVDFGSMQLACFETELRPTGTPTPGGPFVPSAPVPMNFKVLVGQGIAAIGQIGSGASIATTTVPGIGVRVTSVGRALFPSSAQSPRMFNGLAPFGVLTTGILANMTPIFPNTASGSVGTANPTFSIASGYMMGWWNAPSTSTNKYLVELIKLSDDIQTATLSGPAFSIQTGDVENLRIDFGNTRIQGDIGCTLNTTTITKDLGSVPLSKFNAVGSTSGDVSFQVDFNCKPGTQVKMTATAGTPAPQSGGFKGILGLTPDPAGVAQGIGVQLIRADNNSAIPIGEEQLYSASTPTGLFSVPMKARYMQIANQVTTGQAKSTAIFTITYL